MRELRLGLALLVLSLGACRSGVESGNGDLAGIDLAGRDLASGGVHDLSVVTAQNHRVDDSQCSAPRAAGGCSFGIGPGMCSSDSACTMGTNGRCTTSYGGVPNCSCSYDSCQHDTDCPAGQLCVCHGSLYNPGGNTCMPGNCRVDADCNGRACSPSIAPMGCGGIGGYYCHVAADECTNDSDCQPGLNVCTFDANAAHWKCTQELLCP
jgi:hypothetical protein